MPNEQADPLAQPDDTAPTSSSTTPAEFPDEAQHAVVVRQAYAAFSGPLPPPSLLKGYEEVCPGSADRIITMAEKQQQHRHSMEKWGLAASFLLTFTLVIGSIWLVYQGKELTGLVLLIGETVSLAGLFLWGRKRKEQEHAEREKLFQERT